MCLPAGLALGDSAVTFPQRPPEVYTEKLAPLMADLDAILPQRFSFDPEVSDGATLLAEDIYYVDSSGKIYELRQRAYMVVTEAGIDDLSEEIHHFRPESGESITLLRAVTIQPDGEVNEVDENGIFIQTPQREADNRIYSGRKELKIIFPDVRKGSATYTLVLIEREQDKIPGEFTSSDSWASSWPRKKQRVVLDLPEDWAEQLKIAGRGAVPEPEVSAPEEGRRRYVWESDDIPVRPWEPMGGQAYETGPYLKLSTLADWDAFADWYAGVIEESSSLPDELREQVEEWTAGAESPQEVLQILLEKAANDVRYTSINFGNGGVKPQDCALVWKNKYGDCKDKANFLRCLLAVKGIESHVVLLNTDHLGLVEKRAPDYRSFDHAILAVDDGEGGYLFCDPTLYFAVPGVLAPSSSNRDVLIIDEVAGRGIWARTPKGTGGHIDADFDLAFEPNGTLRGWLTYTVSGYYASGYMESYRTVDRHTQEDKASRLIKHFYPDADLVDFEVTRAADWEGTFTLKTYFLVPGTGGDSSEGTTVRFPLAQWLYPYLGDDKEITRDAFVWGDSFSMAVSISLPAGWSVQSMPRPIQLSAFGIDTRGAYRLDGEKLTMDVEGIFDQDRISPAVFTPLYNAEQAMEAWLARPVIVRVGEAPEGAAQADEEILDDFPVMPTGAGQLELALKQYPQDKDPAKYRQALEKVIQYFPQDDAAVFQARMRLGWLDWDQGKEEESLRIANELVQTYGNTLSRDNLAWALYMKALSLRDLDRTQEALEVLQRLVDDETISDYRRAWSAYIMGNVQRDSDLAAATASLERTLEFESGDESYHFKLLAYVLLQQGQGERLKEILSNHLQNKPPQGRELLAALTEAGGEWRTDERATMVAPLVEVLEQFNTGEGDGDAARNLQSLREYAQQHQTAIAIQRELAQWLEENPPAFWETTTPKEDIETRQDFLDAVKRFEEQKDPDSATRHALEAVLRFEPDGDFPYYLWRASVYADWREKQMADSSGEILLDKILSLGETLPPVSDSYYDILFLRARYYERRDDYAQALEIYQRLASYGLPDAWLDNLYRRMGRAAESLGQYDEALAAYAQRLPQMVQNQDTDALDTQVRAIVIHLNNGDVAEARRIIDTLSLLDEDELQKVPYGPQVSELIALNKQEDLLPDYWARVQEWWPLWEAFEAEIGLEPMDDPNALIPAYDDVAQTYSRMNKARTDGDRETFAEYLRFVMLGARWQPQRNSDLTTSTGTILEVYPEKARQWRELAVAMHESLAEMPPTDWMRDSEVWYIVNLYELGRIDEARRVLEAYFVRDEDNEQSAEVMNRLYGLVALKQDDFLDAAAQRMEQDLEGRMAGGRASTVTILADIYRRQGKTEQEQALLAREVEDEQVKQDTVRQPQLKDRYEIIRYEGEKQEQFLRAMAAWRERVGLDWYAYAEPHGLDDRRLRKLPAVLDNPSAAFDHLETVKLRMLAATSTELDMPRRMSEWNNALQGLLERCETIEQANALVNAVLAEPDFPDEVREFWAFMGVFSAALEGDGQQVNKILADSYDFNPVQLKYIESLKAMAAVNWTSVEDVEAEAERLLELDTLNIAEATALDNCVIKLLELGAVEEAATLSEATADITLGTDVNFTVGTMRMDMLRSVRAARELEPVHAAFHDGARKLMGKASPADLPPALEAYASEDVGSLSLEDQWAIITTAVSRDKFDHGSVGIWSALANTYADTHPGRSLDVIEFYRPAIDVAPNDMVRAELIWDLYCTVDNDDPEVQKAMELILADGRMDTKNPTTRALIQCLDLGMAVRKGEEVNVDQVAGQLSHPFAPVYVTNKLLNRAVAQNDIPWLKRYLREQKTEVLLDPMLLDVMIPALELAGMRDELELVREVARKQVYLWVLDSWATGNGWEAKQAIELALQLEEPELLPEAWVQHISAMPNEYYRNGIAVLLAELSGDWPAMEEASRRMIDNYPTFYTFYWKLADALRQQGKLTQAEEPVKVYLKYAHDETDYPLALKLLQNIEAEKGSSPKK